MEAKGKTENKALQDNIEKQVNRLIQQLNDLEELTKEAGMDQEEIEYLPINPQTSEIKKTTKEELKEFQAFLAKSKQGNMSLIDSITEAQLKIQEAISKAFNAKEVMDMYSTKQGEYYRLQIEQAKSNFFTGKINKDKYIKDTFDALIALSKLTAEEQKMLKDFENKEFEAYTKADEKISKGALFGKKTE